ncbi:hypothetical protein CYV19_03120 [Natronobacterium gregoryi SP2]|uniref:Uncharacterized protein n=1 Tax=Natronobacterium gregoryi (strain ATCC 43098 / DSM 3393 / CCM 3738 / CIP 104747 / IAM 13177 / JCM 8860 / NBRC 102187 / NCIMB 2189 / SP2) TaxID=797304 RepID=L9YAM7_NATGS|nr:hypothetical protein C490_05637 [Natronobacterium gregoryi SP2]PLK21566.1 hypothetical protein CYV19_03120 [Natronobacterium gregoryi SP2]
MNPDDRIRFHSSVQACQSTSTVPTVVFGLTANWTPTSKTISPETAFADIVIDSDLTTIQRETLEDGHTTAAPPFVNEKQFVEHDGRYYTVRRQGTTWTTVPAWSVALAP